MSVPFTITKDNWQQIDKLEELRLAYSERSVVFTGNHRRYIWNPTSAIYEWKDGDGTAADKLQNNLPDHGKKFNAQCVAFFRGIQDFVLGYCGNAARSLTDDLTGSPSVPSGYYSYLNFLYYGEANASKEFFRAAGGGLFVDENTFGFRRATGAANENGKLIISRGAAQEQDVLGAWIIDDLLTALRRMTGAQQNQMFAATMSIAGSMYWIYNEIWNYLGPNNQANASAYNRVSNSILYNCACSNVLLKSQYIPAGGASLDIYIHASGTVVPSSLACVPDISLQVVTRCYEKIAHTTPVAYGAAGLPPVSPASKSVIFVVLFIVFGNFTNA